MTEPTEDPLISRSIKAHAERYKAPTNLQQDVRAMIDTHAKRRASGSRLAWLQARAGWLPMGSAFAAGIVIGAIALSLAVRPEAADMTLVALSSDHARALVTGAEIEVPSSDRHTVKPWLSKELGVSPNVVDLASSGFPLKGGRRGYLGSAAVPVMVYGFKNHVIDLYALPDTATPPRIPATFTINGFHCLTWHQDGFTYVAVSDVEPVHLDELEAQLKVRWADPGP